MSIPASKDLPRHVAVQFFFFLNKKPPKLLACGFTRKCIFNIPLNIDPKLKKSFKYMFYLFSLFVIDESIHLNVNNFNYERLN